mmetsp:Transcript_711/g.2463  ORF Transcript_711/g.2463 Transcript_711/m.2463 type:complete len:110 (+) Transcript_711:72-401(+)
MWCYAARLAVYGRGVESLRRRSAVALCGRSFATPRRERARAAKQERTSRERQQPSPRVPAQQPSQLSYYRPVQPRGPTFVQSLLTYTALGFGLFLGMTVINAFMLFLFR